MKNPMINLMNYDTMNYLYIQQNNVVFPVESHSNGV